MKNFLFFIWQLPQTTIGVLLLIFYIRSITYFKGTKVAKIYFSAALRGGISLGMVVIMNEKFRRDKNIIMHELGHCLQSRYLGPLYLIIVGMPSMARSVIWNIFKLDQSRYFTAFPENWAENLGKKYFDA